MRMRGRHDSASPFVNAVTAVIVTSGIATALMLAAGCQRVEKQDDAQTSQSPAGQPASQTASTDPVARGKYLVTIGSCNDCHTPWKMGEKGPEPDMTKMLSGHPQEMAMPPAPKAEGPWIWSGAATMTAFAGPWGVSYAANLTPDDETGIGVWSEDIFVKALKTGTHWQGNRPILPPMPWMNVGQMTDADLSAVFAYLKSLPPVKNKVPEPVIMTPPSSGT